MAIAAVAAIASYASIGATIAGVTITASMVATAATVISVVGVITKSKELTQIGMGMGIAGIGSSLISAASSSGAAVGEAGSTLIGESPTVAGDLASKAGDIASGAGDAGGVATGAVSDPAANLTQYGLDAGATPLTPSSSSIVADARSGLTSQAAGASQPSALSDAGGAIQGAPTVDAPTGPAGIGAPTSPSDLTMQAGMPPSPTVKALTGDQIRSSGDFWGGVTKWAENNKTMASGLLNLGGGALKGIGSAYEADRQYDLKKGILDRESRNANAQPTINLSVNRNAMPNGIVGLSRR